MVMPKGHKFRYGKNLTHRLEQLLLTICKTTGTFDPADMETCVVAEMMTVTELNFAHKFLTWVHADEANRAFDYGNFQARYKEFWDSQEKK